MAAEQKIRDYILQNFLFSQDQSLLNSTDSLLAKGIIDSTGVMEMITFLQEEFGITVEDSEMVPENLDSVNRISAFVARKQAAAGA
ncbi:MAG: acyl carrier protein [Acidithiobacillales bacterium SM23_46]|jgi:acyl carrier protein|nr:MAG: acyl carrier protein [Thiotrichales bacterium SG8_50]KPK73247.1 MAG: acyl carrier protein [Acidithiobacillales bacterium SM23_46]